MDDYRFPKGEEVWEEWARQVGEDGFFLLEAAYAPIAPRRLREIEAVQVLRRAWIQQYHCNEKGVRWREGKDLPPVHHRLCSPYDTDARYGIKRCSGWTGYKAHLTETCEPYAPHVICDFSSSRTPAPAQAGPYPGRRRRAATSSRGWEYCALPRRPVCSYRRPHDQSFS